MGQRKRVGVEIPPQEGTIFGIIQPAEKHCESVIRQFALPKTNNGDSDCETAGSRLRCF